MGFLIGFLIGRTSFVRAAFTAVLTLAAFATVFSLTGTALLAAQHHRLGLGLHGIKQSCLYAGAALVAAILLLMRAKADMFTPRGALMLALSTIAIVIAWKAAFFVPHYPAAFANLVIFLQAATALTAILVFALGVVLTLHLISRQLFLEYLFDKYVKWDRTRIQR